MGCAVFLSELFFGLRECSLGGVFETGDTPGCLPLSPTMSGNVGVEVVDWMITADIGAAGDEGGADMSIRGTDIDAVVMDVCWLKKAVRKICCSEMMKY